MWLVEANTTCSGHRRTHTLTEYAFILNNDSPWKAKLSLNADRILTSLNSTIVQSLSLSSNDGTTSTKLSKMTKLCFLIWMNEKIAEWENITFVTWCSVAVFNLPNDTLNSTSVLLDQQSNLLYEPRVRCTSALLDYFHCVASSRFVFNSCFPCTAGQEGCWSPSIPAVIGYRWSSPWTSQ